MEVFVALTSFLLVVVVVLALCFLPEARCWALGGAQRLKDRASGIGHRSYAVVLKGMVQGRDVVQHENRRFKDWVVTYRVWVGSAALVLVLLPALAIAWRQWWVLDANDYESVMSTDARVLALLKGEDLRPPPPMPPEAFATQEVELVRPLIRYASREWDLLEPVFRQRLLVVFQLMKERHGYELVLLEGYRSPERQARLASLGVHVTQAGACRSYHQFGLAADVAFKRDGRIVLSEKDVWVMKGYELYGEVSTSLGLTWGGAWKTLKDFGHVELRRQGVLGTDCQPYRELYGGGLT